MEQEQKLTADQIIKFLEERSNGGKNGEDIFHHRQ